MSEDAKLRLKIDGEVHDIDIQADETVLEAALRHGIDAPYGCMAGTCNACQGHLDTGTVEMEYCDALTEDEVAAGEILCCQARATSPEIVVSFVL